MNIHVMMMRMHFVIFIKKKKRLGYLEGVSVESDLNKIMSRVVVCDINL